MDAKQSPNKAQALFQNSRASLLLVIVFTILNIGIVLFGDGSTKFLFSAELPYFISIVPWIVVEEGATVAFADVLPFALVGVALLLPYFFAWLFSKNRRGWIIFAVVYFALDTLVMLLLDLSIIDLVFHVWVLIDLCRGLKKPVEPVEEVPADDDGAITPDDVMAEVKEEEKSDVDSFNDGF